MYFVLRTALCFGIANIFATDFDTVFFDSVFTEWVMRSSYLPDLSEDEKRRDMSRCEGREGKKREGKEKAEL